MKFVYALLTVLIFQLFAYENASAEYIFKKDGSIIKGSIVRDAPSYMMIKDSNGTVVKILRDNVMRVIYSELYMGKVYVRLTSGEVMEGYQIDEDRDDYIFRKDINKPAEFKISRKKVMFIARTNPTDLRSDASIQKISLTWSPPFKPAKIYRVYFMSNKKGENFKIAGETDYITYTINDLDKCSSYEIYVTGISDSGEESLPSEKIIANTVPVSPTHPDISELYSDDGKSVTLTLMWNLVEDEASRVKSYYIYKIDDERKKLGMVNGSEFTIKDFPAEGKHRFAVVSVNYLGAESEDLEFFYDAGYKIFIRVAGIYIVPSGKLSVIADPGYGGVLSLSAGGKDFSIGFETGYLNFTGADKEIKKLSVFPFLLTADYRLPLFFKAFLRPVIKFGTGYYMAKYLKHVPSFPADTTTVRENEFNPTAAAGCFIESGIISGVNIFAGAEYYSIFQSSGRMSFSGYSIGATILF